MYFFSIRSYDLQNNKVFYCFIIVPVIIICLLCCCNNAHFPDVGVITAILSYLTQQTGIAEQVLINVKNKNALCDTIMWWAIIQLYKTRNDYVNGQFWDASTTVFVLLPGGNAFESNKGKLASRVHFYMLQWEKRKKAHVSVHQCMNRSIESACSETVEFSHSFAFVRDNMCIMHTICGKDLVHGL